MPNCLYRHANACARAVCACARAIQLSLYLPMCFVRRALKAPLVAFFRLALYILDYIALTDTKQLQGGSLA